MTKSISTLIIVILLLILVIFIQQCNNKVYEKPKIDTIIKKDTIYLKIQGKTVYVPKPYEVLIPKDSLIYLPDTTKESYKEAYFKLATQFLTKNYYNDTIQIKDSLGLLGYLNIQDTIYKNKLWNRTIQHSFEFPKIVETITITKPEKKKTLWFIGGDVLVNYPISNIGVEINGGFLNKKNQYYGIGIQSWNNELIYKLGTKIKL